MDRKRRRKLEREMARVAEKMKATASRYEFDGRASHRNQQIIMICTRVHDETRTALIYTRDTGHHASGWLRNPDYERCLHLSLSPAPPLLWTPDTLVEAELDRDLQRMWCEAFFQENLRLVWAESPKSEMGRRVGVWHWRLFCDEHWQPILPRGEVYSSEFTELGWKSASEVLGLGGPKVESTVDPT
jgi:hypothetical protein